MRGTPESAPLGAFCRGVLGWGLPTPAPGGRVPLSLDLLERHAWEWCHCRSRTLVGMAFGLREVRAGRRVVWGLLPDEAVARLCSGD